MTLTDRLSASFLGALALILIGFSSALYLLASTSLHRSLDDRLQAALGTLAALAEDEPGGLDWEPDQRQLWLGSEGGPNQVYWRILNDGGIEIDRSRNLSDPSRLDLAGPRQMDHQHAPWRVAHRRLRSAHASPSHEVGSKHSSTFLLEVGAPLEPIERPLRNLALTLPLLSLTLWSGTALVGRRLCRTALTPLTRMATDVRSLGAVEPGWRLPVARTGDELQDLAIAFNGLLDRWQEALERQSRFAGEASHQLRTPLTALIGQVDVALRRDRPQEEYRQTLSRVRDQSNRLHRIVESLLFLARAEAEAELPSLEIFDLGDWAADHLRQRVVSPDKPLNARLDRPDQPVLVHSQAALLAEVLDNLLDNARDHAQGSGLVEVRILNDEEGVRLTVEDRGPGIAAAELSRIFEPFYRTDRARRLAPGGVGLGLAVARQIIAALGGRLDVESRAGGGARFVIRLPSIGKGGGDDL